MRIFLKNFTIFQNKTSGIFHLFLNKAADKDLIFEIFDPEKKESVTFF